MTYILSASGIFLLLSILPIVGVAMTMFSGKTEKVVLFSPINGRLTFQGKPASGAKIIRWVAWKDKIGVEDIFYADENGNFQLPLKSENLRITGLAQLVVHQKIEVAFNGTEYQIWGNGKMEKELFTEFGGEPQNLSCELTQEPDRVDTKTGWVVTSCIWDLKE